MNIPMVNPFMILAVISAAAGAILEVYNVVMASDAFSEAVKNVPSLGLYVITIIFILKWFEKSQEAWRERYRTDSEKYTEAIKEQTRTIQDEAKESRTHQSSENHKIISGYAQMKEDAVREVRDHIDRVLSQ